MRLYNKKTLTKKKKKELEKLRKKHNRIKHRAFRDDESDEPVHIDLYQKACLMVNALRGKWEVKKGKVIMPIPKSVKL
jgi:hypothetical protein